MTTYLYIKTHRITGLKYLGKTSRLDPYTYPGSGKRWRAHLDKYGYDFDTEILYESEDCDKIKEMGLYYSNLWNVVGNIEWANLKPESGDGGTFIHTTEAKTKIGDSARGRNSPYKGMSYEEIQKDVDKAKSRKEHHSQWMKDNNPFRGKHHSEETKQNMRERKKGRTWEEIYGIEGAAKRREAFKHRSLTNK